MMALREERCFLSVRYSCRVRGGCVFLWARYPCTTSHARNRGGHSPRGLSSDIEDVFQASSARHRAVEPEQWLQRHPKAASSGPSWPKASHPWPLLLSREFGTDKTGKSRLCPDLAPCSVQTSSRKVDMATWKRKFKLPWRKAGLLIPMIKWTRTSTLSMKISFSLFRQGGHHTREAPTTQGRDTRVALYRGTSLIRKRTPLGPYRSAVVRTSSTISRWSHITALQTPTGVARKKHFPLRTLQYYLGSYSGARGGGSFL